MYERYLLLQEKSKNDKTKQNLANALWEGRDGEEALKRKSLDLSRMTQQLAPQPNSADRGRVIGTLKGEVKDRISPTNLVSDLPLLVSI